MLHYMLPNPLHAPESITCSRIHYMLPNPLHAPEFITCSRIHYMLPNSLHAPESITCSRIHYMLPNSLHAPESITCSRNPLHAPEFITWHFAPCADRDCPCASVSHTSDVSACNAWPGTGSSSISSTQVDLGRAAEPSASSTTACPPLRYVFNAVLSASRLDE